MPPTFDFPLSHFSLTPGLSLKSAPNHSLTVPRVSFCKILGEPGLLRRDLTALPMLRCDITDPTIISNVSVLAIQSIYLPRFLTGCVTVEGRVVLLSCRSHGRICTCEQHAGQAARSPYYAFVYPTFGSHKNLTLAGEARVAASHWWRLVEAKSQTK